MILVVMGVSGSGKTTIGRQLAADLGCTFYEGDDFHPPENVEKMRRGIPLDDADRLPWLDRLREVIERSATAGESAVVACSALKESYRRRLAAGIEDLRFVWLTGAPGLIAERLAHRQGHFATALLPSQLATLEPPADAVTIDVSGTPEEIVAAIRTALQRPA
jgi:gluconokinase